jgi:glycine betaine/proline transport system permease protein
MTIPKIPLGDWIEVALDFLTENLAFLTRAFSNVLTVGIRALESALLFFPPWLVIILFSALAWFLTSRKSRLSDPGAIKIGIFTFVGMLLIWSLGLWAPAMSTIALVLIATLFSVLLGVPLGILAALYEGFYKVIIPILDFMQTMPAFVYLIPAIPFFGLGRVAAMVATIIFSMPPAIRLTCLGIRQIPGELIEAADAFGSTRMQKLVKVQLPLATPTIMAGVNQTIMLSLSMVVIAAMIGAGGLGGEVWRAIQRLNPGMGFEAGLAVVVVAMILDRVTQKIGGKQQSEKGK